MDNSDFAVTVSTQFFWVDNRVIKLKKRVSILNLDPNILNELWIPDFYIYDLQSFHNFKLFRDIQQGLRIEEKENLDSGSFVNCIREAFKYHWDNFWFLHNWKGNNFFPSSELQYITEAKILVREMVKINFSFLKFWLFFAVNTYLILVLNIPKVVQLIMRSFHFTKLIVSLKSRVLFMIKNTFCLKPYRE